MELEGKLEFDLAFGRSKQSANSLGSSDYCNEDRASLSGLSGFNNEGGAEIEASMNRGVSGTFSLGSLYCTLSFR